MPVQLTKDALKKIFPGAVDGVLDDVGRWQRELDSKGITTTRTRLGFFFANIEHEVNGFRLKGLTENINYTAARMAQVWPNRFRDAASVQAKYGTAKGWQLKAFDDIYGNRMGNRPGSRDGSTFIGRAGPQWTGRDGYTVLEKRLGIPATTKPEMIAEPSRQPEVCAAFWDWKNLNSKADGGDFKSVRKLWNGGTNGIADVMTRLKGNDPIIIGLTIAASIAPTLRDLEGGPPTLAPPAEVVAEATSKERTIRNTGVGTTIATGGAKTVDAEKIAPVDGVISSFVIWSAIGVAVGVSVIGAVMVASRKQKVIENWN